MHAHKMKDRARLLCIVGPTAAGKSALAMQLASSRRLAIVSADSRQVYRHFTVGTGKPSASDQIAVRHFGIDVAEPVERYSAHRWATDAASWIRQAELEGRTPVIVGGTGLYIRALVRPLDDTPSLDPRQREALEPVLAAMGHSELQRWCQRLDPQRAHLGRTQLIRAVETALLSGSRISDHFSQSVADVTVDARYLVVDPGDMLASRIASRVLNMVREGFFEEVADLMTWIPESAPAWNACGYSSIRDALSGRISREAAIERTVIASRQYAKRQRTWIRHQLPQDQVTRVNPLDDGAVEMALAWWDARGDMLNRPQGSAHGVEDTAATGEFEQPGHDDSDDTRRM